MRFLTRDPLVATTMDPYGYAHNNPVNATDPSGLCGIFGDGPCTPGGIADDIGERVDDATPDCFTWQDNCESIISQATGGRVCSARYDEGCRAIKDEHSWTWNVSMSLLVAPAETAAATAIGGPGAGAACAGGWAAYGIEGTWSALYNDDSFTKTGTESWKHGAVEGATFATWAIFAGKFKGVFG